MLSAEIAELLEKAQASNETIVFTNGCFEL